MKAKFQGTVKEGELDLENRKYPDMISADDLRAKTDFLLEGKSKVEISGVLLEKNEEGEYLIDGKRFAIIEAEEVKTILALAEDKEKEASIDRYLNPKKNPFIKTLKE